MPDRFSLKQISLRDTLSNNALLAVFVLLILVFSISSRHFTSSTNVLLIFLRTAPLGVVVAGQTLVIITGGIDLSVGSVAGLTSIVAALLMSPDYSVVLPPVPAFVLALALAGIIGWGQGFLISRRDLSPFIVTFSTLSLIKGLALVSSNAAPIPIDHSRFNWMWRVAPSPRPVPIVLMLLVFVGLAYIMSNTKLGRYAIAIGSNETVARMSGVNVQRYKTQVYMLSSLLAGLAGLLLLTRLESGAYTIGENYPLISIAAVVIGGASLRGGTGSAWGSLLGVLLLTMVDTGLGVLNVSPLWSTVVIGALILVAALADVERRRARDDVPAVRMDRPIDHESYLAQMLTNVHQTIKEHLACEHIRLYMVDRETGDVIEQGIDASDRTIINEQNHLARRVLRSHAPLWVDNLQDQETLIIEPIKPDLQSALAVPIVNIGRVVGVLELQSPYASIFSAATAEQVRHLTRSIAGPLEDAWLLDSGWFLRHAREAYRHLWDEVYLGKCALTGWIYASENGTDTHPAERGRAVQQILLDAIEIVRARETGDRARDRRRYEVLHTTYVQNLSVEEITEKMSVSRRQYFYTLKDALETVTHDIVHREVADEEPVQA
ncbi:MAG TPA: GAF domain-containing protein [Aggregatilinea sp.]|uniref:ABC transporter permease subunit n=1 Tax=Aggregatilinea sp. TaxID=2806333 RepID=UPI002B6D8F4B|nr:GAF domain-containing protein [Aggregatilinea sp.]HML23469.1 GAF domain-containing protein [Aggregatilinea sp.]